MTKHFRENNGRMQMVVAGVVGLICATMAYAYACVPLATIDLEPDEVAPGETVRAEARGQRAYGSAPEPVEVRLGSPDGPIVWSGDVDNNGKFSFSFVAPADPGYHVLLLTSPSSGVTGRTVLHVTNGSGGLGPTDTSAWSGEEATLDRSSETSGPGRSASVAGLTLMAVGAVGAMAAFAVMARARRKA